MKGGGESGNATDQLDDPLPLWFPGGVSLATRAVLLIKAMTGSPRLFINPRECATVEAGRDGLAKEEMLPMRSVTGRPASLLCYTEFRARVVWR